MSRVVVTSLLVLPALGAGLLYGHFRSTGVTPGYYGEQLILAVEQRAGVDVATTLRRILPASLSNGQAEPNAVDLQRILPPWRGAGASSLRGDAGPRYDRHGSPLSRTDENRWKLAEPPDHAREVRVASTAALRRAVAEATRGTLILLAPGSYRLAEPLRLGEAGASAAAPVVLGSERLGDSVLVTTAPGAISVKGAYWAMRNLVIRTRCAGRACPPPVELGPGAGAFVASNVFASTVRQLASTRGGDAPNPAALLDGVTIVGGIAVSADRGIRSEGNRALALLQAPSVVIACETLPQSGDNEGCATDSLAEAVRQSRPGGTILLRRGDYRQAVTIGKPGLTLVAEPGATLVETSTGGKGAIVVRADVTIDGLACHGIRVSDGNGACVRQDRGDVTLRGVHFHHAQMGVLTGHAGGRIRIIDSYLHDNGVEGSDTLGHNVYVNSGELEFVRSWSLRARNAGHELKSRASRTLIMDSLIASLGARDSRLVDVPEAGLLQIERSVLGEGPLSENGDLIGYGLELPEARKAGPGDRVILRNVTFYNDRKYRSRLLRLGLEVPVQAVGNIYVGIRLRGGDREEARESLGVPPYPALPYLGPGPASAGPR